MGAAGRVRRAHVAGAFYPGSAERLAADVRSLLDATPVSGTSPAARADLSPGGALAGLIVPHAGYVYGGPVAALAYARLARERTVPHKVAILGPSHFVPLFGAAVPDADAWETPLGRTPIDADLRAAALAAGARLDDAPHAREHAAEVQLPFLAVVCPGSAVLPVAVGDMGADLVADLVEVLAAVPGTLVLVSTDLSHYLDLTSARANDERTARRRGVRVVARPTEEACELLSDADPNEVAAVLHVTC